MCLAVLVVGRYWTVQVLVLVVILIATLFVKLSTIAETRCKLYTKSGKTEVEFHVGETVELYTVGETFVSESLGVTCIYTCSETDIVGKTAQFRVGETLVPSEPHGVIVGTPPPCVGLPRFGTLGCEQHWCPAWGSVRGYPNEA